MRRIQRRNLVGAGIGVAVVIAAFTTASLSASPSSGTPQITIEFDTCLNPIVYVDDSGWVPRGLFPTGPARSIPGTFAYEGDSATFVGDGIRMSYRRVEGFVAQGCAIP